VFVVCWVNGVAALAHHDFLSGGKLSLAPVEASLSTEVLETPVPSRAKHWTTPMAFESSARDFSAHLMLSCKLSNYGDSQEFLGDIGRHRYETF
jgi:hypothetical protein